MASDSESARTYYHYACDSLGSVDFVLEGNEFENVGDVKQRVLCSYKYDVFGNVTDSLENVSNRFGFTGEMLDYVTGQYYLRARYYVPEIGRFTQADTFHGDGLNLYVYAGNNPVRYVDPDGHYCKNAGIGESDADFRRRLVNINDWDGDVNDPSVRLYGTYNELRNAGVIDGHHIVQDAAAKDVSGYKRGDAPAIQADGPSTVIGSEHYNLTYAQSHATTGGTYGIEKNIGLNSLKNNLVLSSEDLEIVSKYLDRYFCKTLGLTEDSPLRIPGNRYHIEN